MAVASRAAVPVRIAFVPLDVYTVNKGLTAVELALELRREKILKLLRDGCA